MSFLYNNNACFSSEGRLRKYQMSILDLISRVEIYESQRNIDSKRVRKLVDYQLDHFELHESFMFPNALILCELPEKELWILIDGQHRFTAMKKLCNHPKQRHTALFSEYLDRVEVHVISVDSMTDVRREFININRSVPVPISILAPCDIIKSAIEQLSGIYISAFIKSTNERRPRLCVEQFSDYLINNHVVEQLNITTSEELIKVLQDTNQSIQNMGLEEVTNLLAKKNKTEKQRIEKYWELFKQGKHLYMGMFKSDMSGIWLNLLFETKKEE
jgi:hypothetical protein